VPAGQLLGLAAANPAEARAIAERIAGHGESSATWNRIPTGLLAIFG
jgi:hypothetical protein